MYPQLTSYFIILFIFTLSLFSSTTMYENGEDNATSRWHAYDKERIYDRNKSAQIIKNRFDKTKGSRIIEFEGEHSTHIYLIGAVKGENAWKNNQESLLSWSMNMQNFSNITVFLETEKGVKYLYLSPSSKEKNFQSNQYIPFKLNALNQGQWQTFNIDLAVLVENDDESNKLLYINGLTIQGKGSIDDLQLKSNKQAFISTWKIDQRKKLHIPTNNLFNYNFHINWGDGSSDQNVTESITHTYKVAGEYVVSITGEYPHIYKICEREQNLITLNQWGTQQWRSMKEAFKECTNFNHIKDEKAPNLSHVKSMYRMFYNAHHFNQKINHWDLSHVNDMNSMFYNAYEFNQDIGSWDLSHVEDMQLMFKSAKAFNQDISQWDLSSVKKMRKIFYEAESFNQNINGWNLSSVIDQNYSNEYKNPSVITDIQYQLEIIRGVNETP